MKTPPKQTLLAAVLACLCVLASSTARSQNTLALNDTLTLAPADVTSSGGDGARDDAQNQQAELAKKLQNPVANLISVPIQNNWDFGIGSANATATQYPITSAPKTTTCNRSNTTTTCN